MKAPSVIVLVLAVVLLAWATAASAAQKKVQKLSQPIRSLLIEIDARGITRDNARARNASTLSNPRVRVDADGRVQIYVYLTVYGEEELATLREREVEIEIANNSLAIVQGWVPFDRLEEIAALSFVRRVTPPSYGFPQTGSVETEADGILRANQLRQLGFDGSGVRVGVISDGANERAVARLSGDLPADITVFGTCTTRPFDGAACDGGQGCNEGTAMLEIVHDIAPGAQLAIGSASTSLEFVQRVNDLVNSFNADVIVDDLSFFGESYFADGLIAQAVAAVADQTVFISAAGNQADGHYEADYRSTLFQGVDDVHNFGRAAGSARDPSMDVSIEPGEFLFTVLQWNDPFGGSTNDYDLFLLNPEETDILCPGCSSFFVQSGSQDPWEGLCYFNDTGNVVSGKLVVNKFDGSDRRVEMFLLGGAGSIDEYATPAGSVFGHAGLPNVLAVGAIDAADPGNDDIEPFSSHGPARVDFPKLQLRKKPDITGIDGVSVTGTGGFPNVFFGTSAAAPHVAGVAALLMQLAPGASAKTIRAALVSGAVDLGLPGPDRIYGAGRVDALAAFDALPLDRVLITNGDFETGDRTGFTSDGINGGGSAIIQEGSCFTANNSLDLTLSGNFAARIRSGNPASTDSIGILTSDPFVAGSDISFRALSENSDAAPAPDPVTLELRVLDAAGNVLLSSVVMTNTVTLSTACPGGELRDGVFSNHVIDTSAFAGQSIRVEFRQHTNVPGRGFFTLVDDVTIPQTDADIDGMPNAFEQANDLNPLDASDAALDGDGDGLSNLQEFTFGTEVNNSDTDGDGHSDGDEVAGATNPLLNESAVIQIINAIVLGEDG